MCARARVREKHTQRGGQSLFESEAASRVMMTHREPLSAVLVFRINYHQGSMSSHGISWPLMFPW